LNRGFFSKKEEAPATKTRTSKKTVFEKQPLPQSRFAQAMIIGRQRTPLSSPGFDFNGVILTDPEHLPEFSDHVRIGVTVLGGEDILGSQAGMGRGFFFLIHDKIAGFQFH
jgi:hypothetical protein